MKVTFYSNGKKIILNEKLYCHYVFSTLEVTKNFVKLTVIKDFNITQLGNDLLKSKLSYKKYLRLKRKVGKKNVFKFKRDKKSTLLIQNELFSNK